MWRSIVVEQCIGCVCVGVHMHGQGSYSLLSQMNHDAIANSAKNKLCFVSLMLTPRMYTLCGPLKGLWNAITLLFCIICHLGFDCNYKCLTT